MNSCVLASGFRGLMLAAMLAALMSSLTSVYNGSSSVLTLDIWRHIRPKVKNRNHKGLVSAQHVKVGWVQGIHLHSLTFCVNIFQAAEREMVVVGRIFGLLMVGLSIAWLPILQALQGGQLWHYLQSISSYITPSWVAVFLLGIFWKKCTEQVGFVSDEWKKYHFAAMNGWL